MPRFSAMAMYMAQRTAAGPLIVMDVEILSTGMPSKRISMSSREETATPQVPNSPAAAASSVSCPMRVGMSKATERPVSPWSRRYL